MTIHNRSASRIALLIPCQFTAYGIERLLINDRQERRTVTRINSVAEVRQIVFTQRINMLVIAFSMQQYDWHSRVLLIRTLRDQQPKLKIVAVVDVQIPFLLQQISDLHIDSILSQHDTLNEIVESLAKICQGNGCYSEHIKRILSCKNGTTWLAEPLSSSELNVLHYLMNGHSVQQTAELISRSKKTVVAIKNKAMRKLGIRHCAELVAIRDMLENQYREVTLSSLPNLEDNTPEVRYSTTGNSFKMAKVWLPAVKIINTLSATASSYSVIRNKQ
ncbi:LuxR C-terminal-related transcriptional regulator [Serratia sp. NPDC078593]|uniref:LuxR C-terminal-related transcriptional regulator n=1 Tax=unclassified Serratia (in: enterobacteria) TaxID=2647522 RepID=UPI0037CCC4B8